MKNTDTMALFDSRLEASLIVDVETATEIIAELLERKANFPEESMSEIIEILTYRTTILIDKYYTEKEGELYFIQGLFDKDDNQPIVESPIVFIQDTVFDELELDNKFNVKEMVIFSQSEEEIEGDLEDEEDSYNSCGCEDCIGCDEGYGELEDTLDDMVADFLGELDDCETDVEFIELLKDYLSDAIEFGERKSAREIVEGIAEGYDLG